MDENTTINPNQNNGTYQYSDKAGLKCPNCKYQDETMVIVLLGRYQCKKCKHIFVVE